MKVITKGKKNFMFTRLAVSIDESGKRSLEILDGVYQIKPEDTTGMARMLFEQDLVKGDDRFLVEVYKVCENRWEFAMVMRCTNLGEFVCYEHAIADAVINQHVNKPTVFTLY